MIDVHCHLEQSDYDKDEEQVIEKCKQQLKAVITCSAHPKVFIPLLYFNVFKFLRTGK